MKFLSGITTKSSIFDAYTLLSPGGERARERERERERESDIRRSFILDAWNRLSLCNGKNARDVSVTGSR